MSVTSALLRSSQSTEQWGKQQHPHTDTTYWIELGIESQYFFDTDPNVLYLLSDQILYDFNHKFKLFYSGKVLYAACVSTHLTFEKFDFLFNEKKSFYLFIYLFIISRVSNKVFCGIGAKTINIRYQFRQ